MIYNKSEELVKRDTLKVISKILANKHTFVSPSPPSQPLKGLGRGAAGSEYRNRSSVLVVICPIHSLTPVSTTFHNYTRCKTGLPCCGSALVGQKLKGRKFSAETLQKMSDSALIQQEKQRQKRGPSARSRTWRKTPDYERWKRAVLAKGNYQCAVTGTPRSVGTGAKLLGSKALGEQSSWGAKLLGSKALGEQSSWGAKLP
jgi:hypothetical protein